MQDICEDDFLYVENFTRSELLQRLKERCNRLKINLKENDRKYFFGEYCENICDFKFNENERAQMTRISARLKDNLIDFSTPIEPKMMKTLKNVKWFCECNEIPQKNEICASNLLNKMLDTAKKNALKPKQGYRYDDDLKRICVHNRLLSGPMAFKTLHLNLNGCFPSISTTNRYIHRVDHAIIEGELRVNELANYLKERNQPMWVCLSEDATRVENRLQYDSSTNQIIGFVLPTTQNGVPLPFHFKARTSDEIFGHFSKNIPVSNFVNTIIATTLGNAPSFCLLVFGSDCRYTAEDVSNRWKFITEELKKVGVGVFSISSDSDPKYNSAMCKNALLGHESNDSDGLFKCGKKLFPPFYFQDYPHISTKMRNFLLKSIGDSKIFPFGNYFIQQQHLVELLKLTVKNKHILTATCLNPADRQNVDSARKISDPAVINLLKQNIKGSEGTVFFLQIMSDVFAAFDRKLSPLDRISNMWRSVFLLRIWRNFILKKNGLTLKNNFITSFCYRCIEINAHSLVFILLFLKKNNLTHLFFPHKYCSQPCEAFFTRGKSL